MLRDTKQPAGSVMAGAVGAVCRPVWAVMLVSCSESAVKESILFTMVRPDMTYQIDWEK